METIQTTNSLFHIKINNNRITALERKATYAIGGGANINALSMYGEKAYRFHVAQWQLLPSHIDYKLTIHMFLSWLIVAIRAGNTFYKIPSQSLYRLFLC